MSLTFERKLPIILSVVFLILTVVGFISYQSTVSLQEAIEWQTKAREVLVALDDTLTVAIESENGMRGFILTGNETYLETYERGKQRITRNIAQLRRLTGDDPLQAEEINNLAALLSQKNQDIANKIEARRQVGFFDSVEGVADYDTGVLMDKIRASIEKLRGQELNILHNREQGLDRAMTRTIWLLIIGSLAGILCLALVNIIVASEIKRRRLAETSLVDANASLESRIKARTAQLELANLSLQESGQEREKLLASERAARREAEIATRLREEFMATVSHELRTPLNSILGWARLMKDGTLDENQMTKAVSTIIKNSETQNRLIEDLIDVARIISGKLELDIGEVNVEELVRSSIETVRPSSNAKGLSINFETHDAAGTKVIAGDKDRLRQIVWNLLANAVKFTPEGGKIDVALVSTNGHLEIKVTDNGAGISPEFLPSVFERFRQDRATLKKSGGLGLGLAVVRNLTEMHGGSVNAYSAGENKGSTFSVKFPIVSEP